MGWFNSLIISSAVTISTIVGFNNLSPRPTVSLTIMNYMFLVRIRVRHVEEWIVKYGKV